MSTSGALVEFGKVQSPGTPALGNWRLDRDNLEPTLALSTVSLSLVIIVFARWAKCARNCDFGLWLRLADKTRESTAPSTDRSLHELSKLITRPTIIIPPPQIILGHRHFGQIPTDTIPWNNKLSRAYILTFECVLRTPNDSKLISK